MQTRGRFKELCKRCDDVGGCHFESLVVKQPRLGLALPNICEPKTEFIIKYSGTSI